MRRRWGKKILHLGTRLPAIIVPLLIAWFSVVQRSNCSPTFSWSTDFCNRLFGDHLDPWSALKRLLVSILMMVRNASNTRHTSDYPLHTCQTSFPFLKGDLGSRADRNMTTRTPTLSCHEKPKDCSTTHSSTLHDDHRVLDSNWPQRIWYIEEPRKLTIERNNSKSSLRTNLLILSKRLLQSVLHWSAPYTTVPTMVIMREPNATFLPKFWLTGANTLWGHKLYCCTYIV